MRISTSTFFESGSARLSDLQSSLMRTQQQISTGRRILTPADDPVAAARAMEVSQSQSTNTQYATNRQNVKDSLSLEESTLQSVTSLIQDVKTAIVGAGSGVLGDSERKFVATDLRGRFDELLGLANSRDGTGNYLFAGYQTTNPPFAQSATGATYLGDQGQRLMQVGPTRQMALSDTGDSVFENNKTGNGTFTTAAASTNNGSGVISPGSVTGAVALPVDDYEITFTVAAGVTTYAVVDTTTGNPVPAASGGAGTYTSGQSISFNGMQFDIKGDPADNDKFTVAPSSNQSIFKTIKDLIDVLNTPATGAVGQAKLTNGLSTANGNLDNALNNILTIRASIGSRLNEIDALNASGSDRDLQYSQTLSELQDLDYTKAITQLTQQQMTLTAAQQAFVKVSNLSLFNYL